MNNQWKGIVLAVMPTLVFAYESSLPETISDQAKNHMQAMPDPLTLKHYPDADDTNGWTAVNQALEEKLRPNNQAIIKRFEPTIAEKVINSVSVIEVLPKGWKDNGKVLVYAHGGGYTRYNARSTLLRCIPVANETGLKVISVDYTTAPKGNYQTITDEVIAVFKGLVEQGYQWEDIAAYGESAGGSLIASAVLKLRDQGESLPAALILWSPWSDITETGDSYITLKDAEPFYHYQLHLKSSADAYAPKSEQKHPYVSPVYGNYWKPFPPVLIQGGTRETFLSNSVRLYQVMDQPGHTVKLDLYEGMPHIFQIHWDWPEAKLAIKKMNDWLTPWLNTI